MEFHEKIVRYKSIRGRACMENGREIQENLMSTVGAGVSMIVMMAFFFFSFSIELICIHLLEYED